MMVICLQMFSHRWKLNCNGQTNSFSQYSICIKDMLTFILLFAYLCFVLNANACSSLLSKRRSRIDEHYFYSFSSPNKGNRAIPDQLHQVNVVIKTRNLDVLHEALMNVSTPGHQDYGKHWTRDKIADLTSNVPSSRKVANYLQQYGLTIVERSKYDEHLIVEGTVAQWETLLSTNFYEFQHSLWNNQIYIRANEGYTLPAEIDSHIDFLLQVNDFPPIARKPSPKHPIPHHGHLKLSSKGRISTLQTIVPGFTTPAFLNQHYNISSNTGNTLTSQACFESLGQFLSPADLATFQTHFEIPLQSIAGEIGPLVTTQIADTPCVAKAASCAESNTDFQYIMGIAQAIPTYLIYYDNTEFVGMLQDVISMNNPPKVISISYGGMGYSLNYIALFNQYAQMAGLMGITILSGSGDDGAPSAMVRGDPFVCSYSPIFPAFSPYVLAVGATQVSLKY